MIARHRLAGAACVLAFCGMLSGSPAFAQQPLSVKEILGKAQSQAEAQAVEDLIRKLQGVRSPPAASAAPVPPAVVPTERPPERDRVIESAAPKASEAPTAEHAAPALETGIAAAAASAQRAVESADQNRLPSVDLEVYFDLGSAAITPQAASALTPLGRALADPRLADGIFVIAGHTDGQGPAGYNLQLSERRAESVRQFLIANFAIDPTRLVAQGFGKGRLKNPRNPSAAENRRVQIVNMARQAGR